MADRKTIGELPPIQMSDLDDEACFEVEVNGVSRRISVLQLGPGLLPSDFIDAVRFNAELSAVRESVNELFAVFDNGANSGDAATVADIAAQQALAQRGLAEQMAIVAGQKAAEANGSVVQVQQIVTNATAIVDDAVAAATTATSQASSASASAAAAAESASIGATYRDEAFTSATASEQSRAAASADAAYAAEQSSLAAGYAGDAQTHAQSSQSSSVSATESAAAAAMSAEISASVGGRGQNLIRQTEFALDTAGWFVSSNSFAAFDNLSRNLPDSNWHPQGENVLTVHQNNNDSSAYCDWVSTEVDGVTPNEWYEFSAFVAAHRCRIELFFYWLRHDGLEAGYGSSTGPITVGSGGNRIAVNANGSGWQQKFVKAQAPADAVSVVVAMRKVGTNPGEGDSWAWFCRPQLVKVTEATIGPVPYMPGRAAGDRQALTATVSQQAGVLATHDGKLLAYLQQVAAAGGSQAAVRLVANGLTSGIELQADAIRLGDSRLPAMDVVGGNVYMYGKLMVPSLSAITATIGVLRTATSGGRLELWDNVIKVFDDNNVLRVQIGNLDI